MKQLFKITKEKLSTKKGIAFVVVLNVIGMTVLDKVLN